MRELGLMLSILIAGLSLAITLTRGLKYQRALAYANLVAVVVLLITNYHVSRQSAELAEEQRRTLQIKVDRLNDQNQTLIDRSQKLVDLNGDCNARTEALTKKLHAPVHFTRGVNENLPFKDSVTVK